MRVFRDDARGLAPLWEPEDWLGIAVKRGAVRPKGSHLTATYEPAAAGAAKRHHLRLPLDATRYDDPQGERYLSPEDPALGLPPPEEIPRQLRFGALLSHRLGSRLIWRATLEAVPSYHRAVAVRLTRRAPAVTVLPSHSAWRSVVPATEPALSGWRDGSGFMNVSEWVAGVSLHESLAAASARQRALLPAMLRRVGAALAEFHATTRLQPLAAPPPRRNAQSERATLQELRQTAGRFFTSDALAPFDGASTRLDADYPQRLDDPTRPDAVLHGDLHDKQLLIDADRVGLIDLDGAAYGPGELDLGNLEAHLVLRAVQQGRTASQAAPLIVALEEGYAELAPRFQVDGALWFRRIALLRLALIYLFRLGPADLPGCLVQAAENAPLSMGGAA